MDPYTFATFVNGLMTGIMLIVMLTVVHKLDQTCKTLR